MSRLKVLVLALFAVLALGVLVASSSASAAGLPSVLPTATTNTTDGTNIGVSKYTTSKKTKIECEKATGTTEETKSPEALGPFHITFTKCTGEAGGIKGVACTGLGDANSGEILVLGEYHLVYDTGEPELGVAILFLVNSLHFTCLGLILNVVSGEQVCLIKEPYVEKTLHEFTCTPAGEGIQSETYLNDKKEAVTPKLMISENEGTPGTAAEEAKGLILWLNAKKESTKTKIDMS